jgi:hypothetical protein
MCRESFYEERKTWGKRLKMTEEPLEEEEENEEDDELIFEDW